MNLPGSRNSDTAGVIIKVIIASVSGFLCLLLYRCNSVGSGWATLNAAMAQHQGDRDARSPVLIKGARWWNYVLLGLLSQDRTYPYDWIIVDSTPGGSVIKNPDNGHFILTCSYLSDLERQVSVDRAVHQFLAERCLKTSYHRLQHARTGYRASAQRSWALVLPATAGADFLFRVGLHAAYGEGG